MPKDNKFTIPYIHIEKFVLCKNAFTKTQFYTVSVQNQNSYYVPIKKDGVNTYYQITDMVGNPFSKNNININYYNNIKNENKNFHQNIILLSQVHFFFHIFAVQYVLPARRGGKNTCRQ